MIHNYIISYTKCINVVVNEINDDLDTLNYNKKKY